jgi:hypothetical protein
MGVFGLGIKVFGYIRGDLVKGFGGFENLAGSFKNRVEVQSCFMVETEIILLLFTERFEKIFLQESAHLVIQRVGGLGEEKGLSPVFIAHAMQGYCL